MYTILLTAWFYLSPVIYKPELLPEKFAWIVLLNPMYYLINLFRAPIFEGRIPTLQEFLVNGGIALVTLLIGWFIFSQKADEFAYRV
jgi:ABC-type polysaccharide/polyol phosphate export permease